MEPISPGFQQSVMIHNSVYNNEKVNESFFSANLVIDIELSIKF